MAVLQDFTSVMSLIVPKDEAYLASVLWHNDLHSENIFVDKDSPTEITGIIDWQNVPLYPACLHVRHPSLINYDGPLLDAVEVPQLPPDIAGLDPVAKEKAKSLHQAQCIWALYQVFIQQQAPDLLKTLHYRDSLPCQIMTLVGSTFDDGEAHVQCLLSRLTDPEVWKKVVNTTDDTPCPLKYSDQDLAKQRNKVAKWEKDLERKARVLEELGAYTGWNGAVPPGDYDTFSKRLETAKERFLDYEANTPEERELWAKAWPFKNG